MDPTIASTIIGVLLTAAFGAIVIAFAWLRSDLDKLDTKFETRFDKMDTRFERLEAKVDGLILGLTRKGFLAGPGEESGVDD